jgi:hypothetical protein
MHPCKNAKNPEPFTCGIYPSAYLPGWFKLGLGMGSMESLLLPAEVSKEWVN